MVVLWLALYFVALVVFARLDARRSTYFGPIFLFGLAFGIGLLIGVPDLRLAHFVGFEAFTNRHTNPVSSIPFLLVGPFLGGLLGAVFGKIIDK